MEEKESKYETKIEKLTFFRILMVFLCEFIFEFSFGLVFFIFTEEETYYGGDSCEKLLYWTKQIWRLYTIEFSIAFVCFLIGILSLFCCTKKLTKVYVGFNNSFKSVIFVLSCVILAIITVVYNYEEPCMQLRDLTFYWLCFHYTLLAIACLACMVIMVVTYIIYRRSTKFKKDQRTSLL